MNAHDKDVPAEKVLFDAANAMRGSVGSARSRHGAFGLAFMKVVLNRPAAPRDQLDDTVPGCSSARQIAQLSPEAVERRS